MNYAVKVILSFIGDTFNIEKCCLNRLDLPANYGVIPIFKVCDLTLFVGLTMKKRRNRIWGPHIGPLTRVMARRIEKEDVLQKTFLLWRVYY